MLRGFEAFSGYGSQSLSLKRLGIDYEIVGISEIDKYAIKAYHALHGEVKNYGDISKIKVEDMPDHDLFTYSFPCQDISIAGNQAGLIEGETRSGLLWECERIIEAKKPKYLLMENVKNLVGKQFKADFDKWGEKLEQMGYTNYWKVLNAKDYGIPQNRERVFMISILGEHKPYVFPKGFDNGIRLKDILENEVDEKYYISDEKCEKLIEQLKHTEVKDTSKPNLLGGIGEINYGKQYRQGNRVYDGNSVAMACLSQPVGNTGGNSYLYAIPCLTPDRVEKRQNGRRFKEDGEPMFTLTGQDRHGVLQAEIIKILDIPKEIINDNERQRRVYDTNGISPSVLARSDSSKVLEVGFIPYPNSNKKHQSNVILSPKGISSTIDTCTGGNRQPKVIVREATKKGYAIAEVGDSINIEQPNSMTRRGRVGHQVAQTLTCNCNQATLTFDWRIRKLTPKECFRLMGLKDAEIAAIQETDISNSQQYKLAGNSIVVDVIEQLFSKLLLE